MAHYIQYATDIIKSNEKIAMVPEFILDHLICARPVKLMLKVKYYS